MASLQWIQSPLPKQSIDLTSIPINVPARGNHPRLEEPFLTCKTDHRVSLLHQSSHKGSSSSSSSSSSSYGRFINGLGYEPCALPPKKLRKLLGTVSDGVHVFPCVEAIGTADDNDGLDDPKHGFPSSEEPSSRKRPWLMSTLKWGVSVPAIASGGFLGLREIYRRITGPNLDCTGNSGGAGGDGSGNRHGGSGPGGDNFGYGDSATDDQHFGSIDISASEQDEEEEGRCPTLQSRPVIYPMEQDIEADPRQFILNSGNVDYAVSEEKIEDLGEQIEKNNRQRKSGFVDKHRDPYFDRIGEDLRKIINSSFSKFSKLFLYGKSDNHIMSGDQMNQPGHIAVQHHQDDNMPREACDLNVVSETEGSPQQDTVSVLLTEKLESLKLDPEGVDYVNESGSPRISVSGNVTCASVQLESAAKQLHDLFVWLAGLVCSVVASNSACAKVSDEKKLVEQKLENLANEAVAKAFKQMTEIDGVSVPATGLYAETLRQLQQQAFSDLLKLKEKLENLEQSVWMQNLEGASTRFKGEVKAGTAFVITDESSSRHSRSSLEQAGMQTGLDVKLTFETPFREKDLLITKCVAGQGSSVGDDRALGGPIALGKVHYLAHVNNEVSFSFIPFGAEGKDVTEVINPLEDQGLTVYSSHGPALFNHCRGSALGTTVSGSKFSLSLAEYISGWGNQISSSGTVPTETDPLCLSTLGQFVLQPLEGLKFSISGLNQYWPSPPLPSSVGLHWSEMGPLVIPKLNSLHASRSTVTSASSPLSHDTSFKSNWGVHDSDYDMDALNGKGTSLLSVAVASEFCFKHCSLGAWAQVEQGDWIQEPDQKNFQWALDFAKTTGNHVCWGASVGGSGPDFWSMAANDQDNYPDYGHSYGSQFHMEAFLRLNCHSGFTIQPGLLYVMNKHSCTPAFILRTSWSL